MTISRTKRKDRQTHIIKDNNNNEYVLLVISVDSDKLKNNKNNINFGIRTTLGHEEEGCADTRQNIVVLLFYVHGKHLRSCRDGQLT